MIKRLIECLPYIINGGYPFTTRDIPSPRATVKTGDVYYDSGEVRIKGYKSEPLISTVEDTNSMDPLIDAGHICVFRTDFKKADLGVGDVIVYQCQEGLIMHRIVKITPDALGRIYTLRGDNNIGNDPYIVRDEHILYLLDLIKYYS